MERYEYKTVFVDAGGVFGGKVNREELEYRLNGLGSQGWELVSAVPSTQSYGSTRWIICIFKRKVS